MSAVNRFSSEEVFTKKEIDEILKELFTEEELDCLLKRKIMTHSFI